MKNRLSLLMITKNAGELLEKSLTSVIGLVDEIVIVDNYSSDRTVTIAKKFGARIYFNREENLGKQRGFGLSKVSNDWVLVLDSDEIVSKELKKEIVILLNDYNVKKNGFYINYQNHYLGQILKYGGENYKMLRLFKKDRVKIHPSMVHEKFELKQDQAGYLKGKIFHHSYRSFLQMFRKFTDYGVRMAKEKYLSGEKSSFKKIFLYPPHLFWARFIKDKGYKDGLFRIPLDLGFAYMEFLTYFLLFFYSVHPKGVRG